MERWSSQLAQQDITLVETATYLLSEPNYDRLCSELKKNLAVDHGEEIFAEFEAMAAI